MLYQESLRVFFHRLFLGCLVFYSAREVWGSVAKKVPSPCSAIHFFVTTFLSNNIRFDFCQRLCLLFNG